MQPKISVIIPIYKVEKYLHRCIDSVVNQTYKNLEIILVDDGSPDKCPKICDEYADKDSRIKVIHKSNGGLSDARNVGITSATGNYISFIDSDDYIAKDFFSTLFETMYSQNSDIVECSVVKFYENNHFDAYNDDFSINTYVTQDALSALIAESQFRQHVWNKLYKSSLISGISFEVGKLNEDEFWTYQIFARAKRVTKINKTMYYYFQRESSIMGNTYNLRRLDALEGKAARQEFIENKFPELAVQAKIDFIASCIYAYQCVLKYMKKDEKKEAIRKINKYRKLYKVSDEELKYVDDDLVKWIRFANISFYGCCKTRALLNIGF